MILPGIYEQVISNSMSAELATIQPERIEKADIDPSEAAKILSSYATNLLQKKLDEFEAADKADVQKQIDLVNRIISVLEDDNYIDPNAQQLLGLLPENDPRLVKNKRSCKIPRPETSMAFSSLFTGAVREPQMVSELKKEIETADSIDMLVSFIKWSGLRELISELKEFTLRGGKLRVITTSYMGATDTKAVVELEKLANTEVKISYDTTRTRLHAKSYIFHRNTGYSTAYVGSSNMSNSALTSGLEWNIKTTENDLPDTLKKVMATFEIYWNDTEFVKYTPDQQQKLENALKSERYFGTSDRRFIFELRPYAYQQEILDRLNAERELRNHHRNLVVAATGTGKTVISAFDYRNFVEQHPKEKCRLLFVAHREEILQQSLYTFQEVLGNPNFGELYVGSYKPNSMDYLFVSVQTANSQAIYDRLPKDYYDFIIVDEFHHAAADTYQRILKHFQPKILLGLTATPERMDGKDILHFFDGRIAAELRLAEAIDRKLLCPFQYFGVSDVVDLNELRWSRGGYEKSELTNVYCFSREIANKRARHIVRSIDEYVTDIEDVKGLGFCVSVEHAKFMAEFFNEQHIPSIYLEGNSKDDVRDTAKTLLVSGEIKFIFVVDLYNEGVDIKEVNTILFLRPTESLTVFLQQLGRGLRLAKDKECLTVLDFVGRANKRYNFAEKFTALLTDSRSNIANEIDNDFPYLPKGCFIKLEKKAKEYVLENIRASLNGRSALIEKIRNFEEDAGKELTFANFVDYYHVDIRNDIYSKKVLFSCMCLEAKGEYAVLDKLEDEVSKAMIRLASIDSGEWILFLIDVLEGKDLYSLNEIEKRMLQMFYVSIWGSTYDYRSETEAIMKINEIRCNERIKSEIVDLMQYNFDHIDVVSRETRIDGKYPLETHATYTRDQILVALDFLSPNSVREGVKWLPNAKVDVLFVTLNKSDKDYSPTTMYQDYAINEEFFHWQSQSTTTSLSTTGQRYINHAKQGSKVLLFVRDLKNDKTGAMPYAFLGEAVYVAHVGEKPMSITWRLKNKIPAKFIKQVKKLAIG